MTIFDVWLDLDRRPWKDLIGQDFKVGKWERIGLMDPGRHEVKPSVYLMVRLENGEVVVGTVGYEAFRLAARAFAATPTGLKADL